MESPTRTLPGVFEELELSCPRCNSVEVVLQVDDRGYFEVAECLRCGYRHIH